MPAPGFTTDFARISLDAFLELPPELRTEAFFLANELTNAHVDASARDVLRAFGAAGPVPPTSAEAVRSLGVAPGRAPAWDWIVRKLRRSSLPPGTLSRDLHRAILRDVPDLRPALDLIDAAAEGYPAFLRGERSGNEILFDTAAPSLWERYFDNENPIYRPGNTLAAHAAVLAMEQRVPPGPVRVLEVGTGCGSAAEALLERAGSRVTAYLATDVSPGFLRKASRRLALRPIPGAPGIDVALLDLDRPAASWPLEEGSFDCVHAVNVLHAVRDLSATLRGLHRLLAPGGFLVLGECVRPARGWPVHPEFVFQLLDEFRNPLLDPGLRPEPGFLDAASWRASLASAGYGRVRFIPDFERAVEAYPEHSLAAIVAWKGAE